MSLDFQVLYTLIFKSLFNNKVFFSVYSLQNMFTNIIFINKILIFMFILFYMSDSVCCYWEVLLTIYSIKIFLMVYSSYCSLYLQTSKGILKNLTIVMYELF